ncbi:MAG: GAF domain-containing protein [Symplocastrum torsivum CPER-KK1]|jgi:DICT domain-containing protein/signal transduction histidine kinase|uniref:histidine kinase n=1 Tax=Symplocastrum torsivum CPER-KK1 TaxID=450513 RepID=A0A951PL86_9CYAN|nr:GAF domain-containing protein [Symplocastrum torsivum CPER-KK1]
MIITTSVLADLLEAMPHLRQQVYFKSSLTALSHAMEDQVLAGAEQPLVIASFQRERFYRQEAHRYRRIAEQTSQVYVLAAPETDFKNSSDYYETVAFEPGDALSQEWHLVVIGQLYANCLICRERFAPIDSTNMEMDPSRRFEGIWTFDRNVSRKAADLLLTRIEAYRPELTTKIAEAKSLYVGDLSFRGETVSPSLRDAPNPDPFVQRLVTYLQAGQYKLLKAYRSISAQEQKERMVNSITAAIRRSLNPDEILEVAVRELGQALESCRCLIYRCKATDAVATITHEFLKTGDSGEISLAPALGQTWRLQDNHLFQAVVQRREFIYVENTQVETWLDGTEELLKPQGDLPRENSNGATLPSKDSSGSEQPRQRNVRRQRQGNNSAPEGLAQPSDETRDSSSYLKNLAQQFSIRSLLLVPVLYQGQLLGMVELHHCGTTPYRWKEDELSLVEAIATQVGVALIQAEAYANLEDLNQQLEALDRTRSNLVAITGHELRTPLSTIQVCLESLATEPDMSPELRQVMLNTALADAERMRKLVQDFLTLSRLESGRVEWHPEALSLQECIDLALSNIRARRSEEERPQITAQVPEDLPLVRADGEWLVEALAKLLDNACKFTTPQGQVTIATKSNGGLMLEVTVADTGRGIEPNRLEAVFDRFYQEEGALRRTAGGTGLGLAICRQIVKGWGGEIWADSAGKDQGSQFHFTVPISPRPVESKPSKPSIQRVTPRNKRSAAKNQSETDNGLQPKS